MENFEIQVLRRCLSFTVTEPSTLICCHVAWFLFSEKCHCYKKVPGHARICLSSAAVPLLAALAGTLFLIHVVITLGFKLCNSR